MIMPYDLLFDLIPVASCLKKRDNEDFLIVLSEDGELYYLNDTAKYIYSLFDSKRSIKDIFNLMKEEYEADSLEDENILKHDIVEIIRDFQWQKIANLMEV